MINVSELTVQNPFASIFPMGEETLGSIRQDMETNGFDPVFPIVVWAGKNIVVDGHTRFAAAKAVGLEEVPVVFKDFDNEDDAILYSFHIQRNRRNMSDDDILRCLELLDNIQDGAEENSEGDKEASPKKTRKEVNEMRAKELGISANKVDKARKVLEHAPEEIRESVNAGEKSINKAYNEMQEIRRESGEIKGTPTTGLGAATKYHQCLGRFLKELTRIRENGWEDVSKEKALADIEDIKSLIESDLPDIEGV
ncbi:MAG: ParB/RepB/Spo0J family partition protein [Desulfobacterales bacterium]|nr:ParB/RepB/Spo0J family partition protein [Desulfobacterales bacterium]